MFALSCVHNEVCIVICSDGTACQVHGTGGDVGHVHAAVAVPGFVLLLVPAAAAVLCCFVCCGCVPTYLRMVWP
jgi:hypothetical protein